MIDKYKLKVASFTTELEKHLDRNKRTIVQTEVEIYEVSSQDNNDGTYNEVYKAKVVGATTCDQGGIVVKGKSKRIQSQRLRATLWNINPSEEFYEATMNKILDNIEDIINKF